MPLLHLSFFKFFALEDPAKLKCELKTLCGENQILGTILLAPEGVNGMATGSPHAIAKLRERLESLNVTEIKTHETDQHAFHRLLIKIKKELIPVGDPSVKPHEAPAPRISPQLLKQWLDEGRPIRLLDARNAYEVEVGTFKNAEHLHLDSSRDFTREAQRLPVPQETVVTFCTGGIRCEKGAAVLQKLGWANVYQLDGGILKYFEEVGSAHFDGNCFVFDWRLAVDGALKPAPRGEKLAYGRHLIDPQERL